MSRADIIRSSLADWLTKRDRCKRFGLRFTNQLPPMDGEDSRIATDILSDLYFDGRIDRDARIAAKAEVDRASHTYPVAERKAA